jgi:hypothetical protein
MLKLHTTGQGLLTLHVENLHVEFYHPPTRVRALYRSRVRLRVY